MSDGATAAKRYDSGAIAFHWTVAAVIVFLGVLGLLFDDIPKPMRPFSINVHGFCRPGLSYTCGRTVGVANRPSAASLAR